VICEDNLPVSGTEMEKYCVLVQIILLIARVKFPKLNLVSFVLQFGHFVFHAETKESYTLFLGST